MSSIARLPSSSTEGFFQQRPIIGNQFEEDSALRRCIDLYLTPKLHERVCTDLKAFGELLRSLEHQRLQKDAERNLPYVDQFDSFGRRVDWLMTSEGWRACVDISHREGLIALGYEDAYGPYARVYQFLKGHLWSVKSNGVDCPGAMQDGAAALLRRHIKPDAKLSDSSRLAFESAYRRLTSRDPSVAWTSGQWMTERPGGSDVRNTETRASLLDDGENATAIDGSRVGPWTVDGFKWFSSATDSSMTIMLAKTGDSEQISAFFAPTRIQKDGETGFNGVSIQRLKNKMGTKPLPTAELVLKGTRAYLIGEVGQGTKEISTVFNITRVHNAVTAVSSWGESLTIARAFAKVRPALGNRLLAETPSHVRTLARLHVDYRAYMLFTFFVVTLLGISEHEPDPDFKSKIVPTQKQQATLLLRLLTPVLKGTSALAAVDGIRACQESLGGVGYLENEDVEFNVARILRDTCVLPIWEGTTEVISSDLVRVLKGKSGSNVLSAFKQWTSSLLDQVSPPGARQAVYAQLRHVERTINSTKPEELLYSSRHLMFEVQWITCSLLMAADARRDRSSVAQEMAKRFILKGPHASSYTGGASTGADDDAVGVDEMWRESAAWDKRIVFEANGSAIAKL